MVRNPESLKSLESVGAKDETLSRRQKNVRGKEGTTTRVARRRRDTSQYESMSASSSPCVGSNTDSIGPCEDDDRSDDEEWLREFGGSSVKGNNSKSSGSVSRAHACCANIDAYGREMPAAPPIRSVLHDGQVSNSVEDAAGEDA